MFPARYELNIIKKNLEHSVPVGKKYRNLALQVGGVSEIETKYAHESRGTQS
jgi:hypothetical protein